jgi:hypothetical protein
VIRIGLRVRRHHRLGLVLVGEHVDARAGGAGEEREELARARRRDQELLGVRQLRIPQKRGVAAQLDVPASGRNHDSVSAVVVLVAGGGGAPPRELTSIGVLIAHLRKVYPVTAAGDERVFCDGFDHGHRVAELDDETVGRYSQRLWIVPPGGSLL